MAKKKTPRDKAWEWFSKYYRIKNSDSNGDLRCYTCDKVDEWKYMQTGHLLDGRYNSILFDEDCVKPQCYGCNCGRSGNKEVYIPKFIDRYGREFYESLRRKKNTTVKYSKKDYEEMRDNWKGKAKAMAIRKGIKI